MSDSGWFKKFLGENPNAKALRERLEEATALLAAKDEALSERERRLTDATALAQREADSARALEERVRELSEAAVETDVSRGVTADLLKQAEASASQLSEALAAERSKLAATNQARVKAETSARALTTQIQNLEKQVLDFSSKVANLEQERAGAQDAKVMLETALARSERRRETTLTELSESRANGEKLSITCENLETQVHALRNHLEAHTEALRHSKAETMRCRIACGELVGVAVRALHAAVGRAVPVALRLGVDPTELYVSGGTGKDAHLEQVVADLQRWFADAGLAVTIAHRPSQGAVIELKTDATEGASSASTRALGYLVAGLTMHKLERATDARYDLTSIVATGAGATVTLKPAPKARAAQ